MWEKAGQILTVEHRGRGTHSKGADGDKAKTVSYYTCRGNFYKKPLSRPPAWLPDLCHVRPRKGA